MKPGLERVTTDNVFLPNKLPERNQHNKININKLKCFLDHASVQFCVQRFCAILSFEVKQQL